MVVIPSKAFISHKTVQILVHAETDWFCDLTFPSLSMEANKG